MLKLLKRNKEMLWDLAINDFSTKYAGSYLGIFWAFVQPIVTILVYWCVFEFGLKATPPVANVKYIVWFSTGMVPWFFFSDGVNATTNSLLEYSYLVKKIVFDVELLPFVKILSTLFVHGVFIVLLVIVSLVNGSSITIFFFQIIYYIICSVVLIYAIGNLTSSIILFFRDLGQIVNIILQIGVWVTPIIWPCEIVPSRFQWIVKMNPVFYIVEGYRACFITKEWFFESPLLTLYFWAFTLILLIIGRISFKKLRSHFADVL